MTIACGTRLGPYEILAQIGAGGMGEVYRAHDTKLGRDVAIKVLPEAFAHDPQRLARFQREAKLLASLNHPNIATIHGLEESNGTHYLVMELVPGETLRERVAREGPVPIEEALAIAKQIAEALEAAHEKSIIHRDLKPANVKVTPEGKVKVLDFGLAKAFEGGSEQDLSQAATLSALPTEEGRILGTPAYMSPEQAQGKPVDKRADIWAFGVVLYELLTGERLFKGDGTADMLAQVLTKEPDLGKVQPKVQKLLARCLEKDPKKRLRDIGEAAYLLDDAPGAGQQPVGGPESTLHKRMAWIVAAVLTIALAGVSWIAWRATRPLDRPLVRLDVDLGPDVSLGSPYGADAILSPDGTRLVYVSQGRLFTRRLDQPNATELAGTQGASAPFLSPEGQWVAFYAQGKLKKISVEGGAVITLCDAPYLLGGSWGEDGSIIAALNTNTSLSRVPSAGGTPTPVTELQSGEGTHRWPQILPGGKAVLFTANSGAIGFDTANIEVMSLADHQRKTLQRGGTFGRYLPSGHLLYVNRGTLFAVPFDLDRLEVRGTPAPVLDQVSYRPGTGSAQLEFSQTGTLVYRSGGEAAGLSTVQWLDATGKTHPLLQKIGQYLQPSLSPDGQRLALTETEGGSTDIWVYDWQRDTPTRLTFGPQASQVPVWSPDGRYILFQASGGIFWTRSDGSGKPQQLTQSKNVQFPWSFTGDGKRLAFFELSPQSQYDLWTVSVESDGAGLRAGKPEPFLQTPFDERHGSFSPDGRWMAHDSNESGSYQVYVRAFPDKGGKWQISNNGGMFPVWSRNGQELFFRTEDNQIMVANYTLKGDSFVADKPRAWSDKRLANLGLFRTYDLAPDGKRIAALMPAEAPQALQAQSHVIFLENFFDEVRRRTATQAK